MKISNLREFLLLTANRNYSKTAEQLYMAQSTLSRHVAEMEEEMGVQLIRRTTSSFELTEAGEAAVEGFGRVLAQYQETLRLIGAHTGPVRGELRLGVLYYDVHNYVARIRSAFHQHFPDARLRLFSYQPEQQETALLNGEIDAALLYDAVPPPDGSLTVFPFLKTPFRVLFPPGHPFDGRQEIRASELDGLNLLNPPAPYRIDSTYQIVSRILAENHVIPRRVIPIINVDEAPILLAENDAIFLAPMVNPGIYQGTVRDCLLEPERYSSSVSAVWKGDHQDPLIHALVTAIKIAYP